MKKTKIFLAGDSTVQTYKASDAPQCGWGAMLYKYFDDLNVNISHSVGSAFENSVTYEMREIVIDNRAMAGRSLKSFYDEGRWSDLLKAVNAGDYVLIQSAHNDAYREKKERYLSPDEYMRKLEEDYIGPLLLKKAVPVLVTAIAMKDFDESGSCRIAFPEYRNKMLALADKLGLYLIDLGKKTAEYNSRIGEKACSAIYMNLEKNMFESAVEGKEDNAHLKFEGAFVYAGLAAKDLKEILSA